MEKEKTATEQLSQILDETGYNYITPYGFKLLRENEMVTNQKQAKIMAQLVKDTCSAAFAEGRVMQAYKDGFEQGQNGAVNGL